MKGGARIGVAESRKHRRRCRHIVLLCDDGNGAVAQGTGHGAQRILVSQLPFQTSVESIAAKINEEVRRQYILGFAPSGQGELRYRVVVVSVAKPGKWVVRTRRGYRGTMPSIPGRSGGS